MIAAFLRIFRKIITINYEYKVIVMGKIHEALQKKGRETGKNYLEPLSTIRGNNLPALPIEIYGNIIPEWYKELKFKVEGLDLNGEAKSIMFMGAGHSVGTTTICTEFAMSLSQYFQHKTLLIDLNINSPGIASFFNKNVLSLQELMSDYGGAANHILSRIARNLSVVSCKNEEPMEVSAFVASKEFSGFMQVIKKSFDYILFDSAPLRESIETRIVGRMVDGVVLVIGAGHSRKHVAMKLKRETEESGISILGVVLNRRKYYIPKWIYNRL